MLPTRHTLMWIERRLHKPSRILEVGCGTGELAAELMRRGHSVTAVDSDAEAVRQALDRGVSARQAQWPDFHPPSCDAVLFTRSLHHIAPLAAAVEQAARTAPLLLIEDFALTEVSPRFEQWLQRELAAAGREEWHPHDVHPFASIRAEVAKHYRIEGEEQVPYAYRYFQEEQAGRIYEAEEQSGELLGRRLVAVNDRWSKGE